MEDIIDIIVTETTNTIEITSQASDELIDVNIIDNREDITLNVTPTLVEININSLTGNFGVEWGDITGTLADQTDLNTALGLKADLVGGKVPSSQLPSYVDDIVEVANYAALPATGETGKIYVVLDTNKIYRWSGSAYIEIADSTAVWGAITGTLSSQTDLQSALDAKQDDLNGTGFVKASGTTISYDNSTYLTTSSAASTYVPYTGATGNVDLGTHTLLAAKGTFSSSGSDNTVDITHSSGSGIALNISKAGNGEGIYVNKSSGSGNAVTIVGTLNATTLVKSGGTSAQFLKADGSVDSSTYVDTSTNQSIAGIKTFTTSVHASGLRFSESGGFANVSGYTQIGGTADYFNFVNGVNSKQATFNYGTGGSGYTYTLPNSNGTLALTSQLSSYLPLSGGTLTGALSGTSATFSSSVTATGGFGSAISSLSAWGSSIVAPMIEGIAGNAIANYNGGGGSAEMYIVSNAYYNGSNWVRKNASASTILTMSGVNNSITFGGAATGTAGSTFSFNNILSMNATSGNVGIGTTSPGQLLHLYGASIRPTIESTNNGSYASLRFVGKNTSGTSRTFEVGLNISADDVWQITDGASNLLSVSNVGALKSPFTYSNTTMNLANLYMGSTGTFERSVASSRRFKENINSWSDNGLNTILALNPVTFTYKSDYYKNPETLMLGLIAEEVAEVSPYLADFENEDRTGQVENVRYAHIVVPLIKAVQELKAELDTLKNK